MSFFGLMADHVFSRRACATLGAVWKATGAWVVQRSKPGPERQQPFGPYAVRPLYDGASAQAQLDHVVRHLQGILDRGNLDESTTLLLGNDRTKYLVDALTFEAKNAGLLNSEPASQQLPAAARPDAPRPRLVVVATGEGEFTAEAKAARQAEQRVSVTELMEFVYGKERAKYVGPGLIGEFNLEHTLNLSRSVRDNPSIAANYHRATHAEFARAEQVAPQIHAAIDCIRTPHRSHRSPEFEQRVQAMEPATQRERELPDYTSLLQARLAKGRSEKQTAGPDGSTSTVEPDHISLLNERITAGKRAGHNPDGPAPA